MKMISIATGKSKMMITQNVISGITSIRFGFDNFLYFYLNVIFLENSGLKSFWTTSFTFWNINKLIVTRMQWKCAFLFFIAVSNPLNGFYTHPSIHPSTHPSRTTLFHCWKLYHFSYSNTSATPAFSAVFHF